MTTKKKLKITVSILFLLFVLILVVPFLIPIDRYKPFIIQKIEENMNGEVEIGHIGLRLIPFIGLKLEDVSVANKADSPFQGAAMVKLPRFDFRIQLKSLLFYRVIASLHMDKPEVTFTKLAN